MHPFRGGLGHELKQLQQYYLLHKFIQGQQSIKILSIFPMQASPQQKPMGSTSMKASKEFTMTKTQVFSIADNFQAYACSIKYLNSYNYKEHSMNEFTKEAEDIMKYINSKFSTTKYSYLPWIKFLDVAYKMVLPFLNHLQEFKNKVTNVLRYVLLNNGNKDVNQADWRVLRKIYSVQSIIQETFFNSIDKTKFIQGFIQEINNSLKYLIWVHDSFLIEYTRNILTQLKKYCMDKGNEEVVINSIKNGRFDKKGQRSNKIGFLEYTLIFGEDGGLFLLLNSLDDKFRDALEHHIGKEYIKEKSTKGKNGKAKVVLGKGSFGQVRFAINLLYVNKYPGDIVCVKKTNTLSQLSNNSFISAEEMITNSTLEDYFASEMSDLIYSPKVLDMAIVIEAENKHQKGYLFMEIIPENTGTKIFSKSKYQKWQYQKPYLLDLFDKVNKLLSNKIAFTDLKPDNTLFNVFNRKTSLIDLGGTVKDDDLSHYKGSYQYTAEFSAPEINNKQDVNQQVDLIYTVGYACGLIVKYLSKTTDFNKKQLEQFAERLMVQKIPLDQAYKQLQKIGDQKWKEAVIFTNYTNRIQLRLQTSKSSININEDIEETIKTFIPLNATLEDPFKYSNLPTVDLFKQIDSFLKEQSSGVFLLLGKAGSGKSVVLQQKFIEYIHNWSEGKPLPIFFNLANNTSLPKILQALDDELITNLTNNVKGKPLILFIDSFDQGVDMHKCRETLINEYFSQLSNQAKNNVKIIISCRSDYLQDDKDDAWFKPTTGIFQKYYITPLDYIQDTKWNEHIKNWCKLKGKQAKASICIDYIRKFKDIIATGFIFQIFMEVFVTIPQNLTSFVNKIELYKLYIRYYIIKRLEKLNKEQRRFINQSFIKTNPHTSLQDRMLEIGGYLASKMQINSQYRLKNQDQIFSQLGYRGSEPVKIQKIWFMLKLLPLKLQSKETFTTKYDFKQEVAVGFIHDTIKNYFLLQEIKKELKATGISRVLSAKNISDNVELVGFIRDTIENYQNPELIEQLKELIKATKTSKAPESITAAANAITILTAAQICLTAFDFSNTSIKGANLKNGVFQHSDFTNADLSGCDLTNADLIGCKFNGTNMASVELSTIPMLLKSPEVIYTMVYAPDSKTFAMSVESGLIHIFDLASKKIINTLKGHEKACYALVYSKDGSRIVSGSMDMQVFLWQSSSGQRLASAKIGHQISGVSYSPDGTTIAVGSDCSQIKILNASNLIQMTTYKDDRLKCSIAVSYSPNGKELTFASKQDKNWIIVVMNASNGNVLHKIEKDMHTILVNWICYSPDGRYLASCSKDKTIKIWNAQKNYELIKTIHAHSDSVVRVAFSPNGKFIASGSYDRILKIIDVETTSIVKEMYGHSYCIISVCYSPDSRYIITGGGDQEVRMWDTSLSYKMLQNIPKVRKRIEKIGYRTGSQYIAVSFDDKSPLALFNLTTFRFFRFVNNDSDHPQLVTISPDFKDVVYAKQGIVYFYNIETNKAIKKDNGDIHYLCLSDDCKWAISKHNRHQKIDFSIWNLQRGKMTFELKKSEEIPACTVAAISYDNQLLAIDTGCTEPAKEKLLRVFRIDDGTPVSEMDFQVQAKVITFSRQGTIIAGGSNQQKTFINVWNPEDGDLLVYFVCDSVRIMSLRCLKTQNRFLVGYENHRLYLYKSQNKTMLEDDLYGHNGQVVDACVFSQDERKIISASYDCTLRMWELKDVGGKEKWCYSRSIIGAETPFAVAYSELNNVRNLSPLNLEIFKERYAEIKGNCTGSDVFNPQAIDNELIKYRVQISGELQRSLPAKQIEINLDKVMNNQEESEMYRKPEKSLQVALLNKHESETQNTNYNGYSGGYDDGGGSSGGCCCSIYRVTTIYDNPLLNIKDGIQKAAILLNCSVSEALTMTAQDKQLAVLLAKMVR